MNSTALLWGAAEGQSYSMSPLQRSVLTSGPRWRHSEIFNPLMLHLQRTIQYSSRYLIRFACKPWAYRWFWHFGCVRLYTVVFLYILVCSEIDFVYLLLVVWVSKLGLLCCSLCLSLCVFGVYMHCFPWVTAGKLGGQNWHKWISLLLGTAADKSGRWRMPRPAWQNKWSD